MTVPGSATGHANTDIDPDEGLYVPVVNLNYIPEGVGIPEGYVPDHPADDRVLTRIKDALETQGHVSGQDALDQKIQQLQDEQDKLTAPGINSEIDPVTGSPVPTEEDKEEEVSPSQPDTEEDTTGTDPQDPEVSEENPSKPLF
jgi:hypothetical protein